jgi:hypothetical protein
MVHCLARQEIFVYPIWAARIRPMKKSVLSSQWPPEEEDLTDRPLTVTWTASVSYTWHYPCVAGCLSSGLIWTLHNEERCDLYISRGVVGVTIGWACGWDRET